MTARRIIRTDPHAPEPGICIPDTPLQRLCLAAIILFPVLVALIMTPNPIVWP